MIIIYEAVRSAARPPFGKAIVPISLYPCLLVLKDSYTCCDILVESYENAFEIGGKTGMDF